MPKTIPLLRSNRRQRGAALLITMLLVVLGLVTLLTLRGGHKAPELDAQRKTTLALAQAKEALLGWAATDGGSAAPNPGRLLCPDQSNNGISQGAACSAPYLGRVPWVTLNLGDVRDGAAERLWYIVDPQFRSSANPMNSTILPTNLSLNGNNVVAVIFAPGPVLGALNQQRDTIAHQLLCANYLETCANIPAIVSSIASATYNDHVLAITAQDIFTVVTFRMARELAQANAPPYVVTPISALVKSPTWINNQWDSAVDPISSVSSAGINLKFLNCASRFTITGQNSVSRSGTC